LATKRDFLGPFQLLRLIRSGTTTQVWEALRTSDRERVALKVLLREVRDNKAEVDALVNEAKVGKSLDHKNVIKIYDFQNEHGLPFISMELFNVRNLKIELRERPVEIAAKLSQIIQQCAEGLQHLHDRGWVHCDVKPDNFLVNEEGVVKLIDFSIAVPAKKGGLAGLFGGGRSRTIRGTRSYMAPEQIRRQPLDGRADIYGLGCVIFEMLSGRTPFTAPNPDELLKCHLSSAPPNLVAISGATQKLANLVHKMMEKDPAKRPQSMLDFLGEFQMSGVFRPGKRPKLKE
jgi:serine/threonine protein kinase